MNRNGTIPAEPQHEAEDVEPAAARERRHVGIGRRSRCRCGGALGLASMRLAPMRAPADLDIERHVELHRRFGGFAITCLMTAAASSSRPSGTSNTSSSCTCSSIRTPSSRLRQRLVHPRHRPLDEVGARALDRRIDRGALGAAADRRIGRADVGLEMRLPPEQGAREAMLAGESRACCG